MCKVGNVMFKKMLLKIFIIFISLFIVINHFIFSNMNVSESNKYLDNKHNEDIPSELREVRTSPYIKPIGHTSITHPVFKTSLKVQL